MGIAGFRWFQVKSWSSTGRNRLGTRGAVGFSLLLLLVALPASSPAPRPPPRRDRLAGCGVARFSAVACLGHGAARPRPASVAGADYAGSGPSCSPRPRRPPMLGPFWRSSGGRCLRAFKPAVPADAFALGDLPNISHGRGRFYHDGHILTCAPTGAGKGVGAVIPNLIDYPGSAFVLDLKGENFAVTARARRQAGQYVFLIDPFADFRCRRSFVELARHAQPRPLRCRQPCWHPCRHAGRALRLRERAALARTNETPF